MLLLEKASERHREWRNSLILQQMIKRYYRFMQLKVLYPEKVLIPTIDIELVWQTHLLRPSLYRDDCLRLFHRIIDHSLFLNYNDQVFKEQAFLDTLHLYEKHFHQQYYSLPLCKNNKIYSSQYNELHFDRLQHLLPIYSYWDDKYVPFFSTYYLDDFENPFSFTEADIILDGNWINLCKNFMNSIFLNTSTDIWSFDPFRPMNLNSSAMKRLKKSYERFLYITAKYFLNNEYTLIHPTYAV